MFERTFSFWRRLMGKNPPAPATGGPQDERRVWVRHPSDLKTSIHLNGKVDAERHSVVVRNISLGGASLLIDHALPAGTMISLELPGSSEGESHEVLACIVHVTRQGSQWSLGCVFSRELSAEDLEGFGAKKVRPSGQDKRTWMRFDCSLNARYQRVGGSDNPVFEGKVVNLSPSGVGIFVDGPIEPGTLLTVDLMNAGGQVVRTILACVVHLRGQAGGPYSLGCNFIRQLQEEELAALV